MQRIGRRHVERAHYDKRSPQIKVSDINGDDPPSIAPGLPLTGPITLTITRGPQPSTDTPSTGRTSPSSSLTTSASSSPTTTRVQARPTSFAPVTPTQTPTTIPPVLAPTVSPSPNAGAAASGARRIPAGGVAGIVIGALVFLAVLFVFLMRKSFMTKRKNKRATWRDAVFSPQAGAAATQQLQEKPSVSPTSPRYAFQAPNPLLPPPVSYNNPEITSPAVTSATLAGMGVQATVQCTFIPNLPDELHITTGEIIRILGEYDDGWALCANTRGEQGMVPLECLEKSVSSPKPQGVSDWRNAQRASSLGTPGPSRH